MEIVQSYAWLVATMCGHSIAAIMVGIMFILECIHGIRFVMKSKKKSNQKTTVTSTKPMWCITILSIICFWITGLLNAFAAHTYLFPSHLFADHVGCNVYRGSSYTYIIAKTLMYLLFILRLYNVYKDTAFEYSSHVLMIMASVSIALSATCLILTNFWVKFELFDISHVSKSYKTCLMSGPFWLSAFVAFNDLLNEIVLIYLFVKPLIWLQKQQNQQSGKFRQLSLKYYILALN
eukprot:207402_1